MNIISRIRDLAESSLIEAKLIVEEEGAETYRKPLERMTELSKKVDKTELAHMSNFEIFMIFTHLFNGNIYSYYETLEYATEIKDSINSWTYEKNIQDIKEIYNNTAQDGSFTSTKAYKYFSNLGLSTIFADYNMKPVYECIFCFLNFKHKMLNTSVISKIPFTQRRQYMNKILKESGLKDCIEYADKLLKKDIENYEFRKEIATNRIECLKELLLKIDDESFDSISEMPANWHRFISAEVLEPIYELIQSNLLKQYQVLEQEEQRLNSITNKTPLISYLYSKGLNPYSLPQDKLSALENIPQIVEYINFLENLELTTNEVLTTYYDILTSLTEEKISYLNNLINIKSLSKETLKNNLQVLDKIFLIIKTNYEILSNIIDYNSIFYSDSILLIQPTKLKEIISVLSKYSLSKNNYIFLLCNYEYLSIYDLILESDISEELFISICKTENPLNTIKRIKIYINLNEQYETPGGYLKKDVTSEEKFICDDADLDTYLPDITREYGLNTLNGTTIDNIESSPTVRELDEKYQKNINIYEIGSAKISRPKFLRNFKSVEGNKDFLISSLVSNSILDTSEYYNLINELNTKQLKK